ncbi:MAG: ribosome recycling factor [Candidatus Shapirobacteria bacterium]
MLNTSEIKAKMERSVALFVGDIGSIRTGRATPALIENVMVSVYGGQKMRLMELGSIGVPDVRMLTFTPWDQGAIREIANGITAANIGMSPTVDGELIRMSLPALTGEQREDFVKLLGRKLEGIRGIIRDIRADVRRKLMDEKQDKTIGEDEFKRNEIELQKLTDEYVAKVEAIAALKEKEIRG